MRTTMRITITLLIENKKLALGALAWRPRGNRRTSKKIYPAFYRISSL